jgi:hypothetical protein
MAQAVEYLPSKRETLSSNQHHQNNDDDDDDDNNNNRTVVCGTFLHHLSQ